MSKTTRFIVLIASIVALGGLLMGFDASVISGVVKFIEIEFNLTKLELGWSVSSLTLTSTLAMLAAGPISDKYGRRYTLKWAAMFFLVSAVLSAIAPNFIFLVFARMLGGFGVGAALIIAPMYIAEVSPAKLRGTMVSFNQLNIVVGISLAFFTNYLILSLGDSDASWVESLGINKHNWRWMLGLETIPAVFYFLALFVVPRSPRWLLMHGKEQDAVRVFNKVNPDPEAIQRQIQAVKESLSTGTEKVKHYSMKDLLRPALALVMTIGVVVGILQQITGINSVFFYAPMIFEQTGIGTDAAFIQAILVGLTNLVFTVLAMLTIDKLGRKPLLSIGVLGIAGSMFLLAYGFSQARYELKAFPVEGVPTEVSEKLEPIKGIVYDSDIAFKAAIQEQVGRREAMVYETNIITAAITANPMLILVGVLSFVAFFAMSLGPIMWVLFSELFPNYIRGLAISFVGFVNSMVSFTVQLVFPWELNTIGNVWTFFIYGLFALAGFIFVIKVLPETKGKSLEELEKQLVRD